ncbi:MAG: hypothetical protein IJ861_03205 [Clostridia bacterium]|nr:hypothetical protein [Clostridia bacterium]
MSLFFDRKIGKSNQPKQSKCFISHCSDDNIIMNSLSEFIDVTFGYNITRVNNRFFCTYHNSVAAGIALNKKLNQELNECDYMIAVITDSYVRSTVSIYELCSFYFAGKPVIPIIYNGVVGEKFIRDIFNENIVYIKADKSTSLSELSLQFLKSLSEQGLRPNVLESQAVEYAERFFEVSAQKKPSRSFIGCDEEKYDKLIRKCAEMGICEFRSDNNGNIEQLADSKELFILSTTGDSLIKKLSEFVIPKIIRNGGTVIVLIPNKESAFCRDIAEIENPDDFQYNQKRLDNEFDNVIINLRRCVKKASEEISDQKLGKIYIGCAFNLLRQTITLGITEEYFLGWMSVTIPPKRTVTGTPTIDFKSEINCESGLGYMLYHHINAVCSMAKTRNCFFEITYERNFDRGFYLEPSTAKDYWQEKSDLAVQFMREAKIYDDILIEVAAQHPLHNGNKPGPEFAARLDFAFDLYKKYKQIGKNVKMYVPGSIHKYKGKTDNISLSKSGCDYLLSKGAEPDDLYGEEMNNKYKGESGVYNSADECFVAKSIFFDGEFNSLFCVCSPNQMMRKKLFYLEMGILPKFYTVPCDIMFHSDIYEIFEALPNVIYQDHSQQEEGSEEAVRTRKERKPGYI